MESNYYEPYKVNERRKFNTSSIGTLITTGILVLLLRDEIQAIKVDKLFTLGALPNEVIRISTDRAFYLFGN